MPGGLDSQHMKEFKEKGKTTVVLWSNQSGKSIRVVERCLVCKGQPKSCFLCGGSGRDYNGGTCLNCLGQGREHCAVCMNRGYNDDTTVYDSNGKVLTLNGKTPQQTQAETDALYARKEAEATGYSKSPNGGHYERAECVECHGRQVCPTCSGGKQVYIESTKKWVACWNCGGSGTCKRCGGAGYSSSVRFVPNEPNSRHQRDPYNFDTNGRQICQHCHGLKHCPTCSGNQKVYNDGIKEWVPCWDCGSTGTCKRCGGNGHELR